MEPAHVYQHTRLREIASPAVLLVLLRKSDHDVTNGLRQFKEGKRISFRDLHAAKAEMVRGAANFALAARADHVAGAILIGAEK